MALIKPGNGSSLSGLVGSVVIVNTKWGSYMRSAPNYTKNSWTQGQKAHRERFKLVSSFCRQFKETLISQIWNDPNIPMSGHALFLKTNMKAFSPEGMLTDPMKLQVSKGELTFPQGFQTGLEVNGQSLVKVSWPQADSGIRWRDELMAVSTGEGIYSDILNTGILRGHKGGTFLLPELKATASHIHLFFGSRDRRSYSISECFELNFTD